MSYSANTININLLGKNMENVPRNIISAIDKASKSSGVDFSYLVNQAQAESNFNTDAKAKTSSATGLYQFIDSTWLDIVDKYGKEYGIETTGKSRSEILAMRKDPEKASFMAAAFASENERFLKDNWCGDVGATELYLAHFLGASGAASFLNARDENPIGNAADLNPKAALANRNVFYDRKTGKSRTLEEVYQFFNKKFQKKIDVYNNNTQVATAPLPPSLPTQKTANKKTPSPLRLSENIIMKRAQAMREDTYKPQTIDDKINANNNSIFTKRSLYKNSTPMPQNPFFSLIAKPLDLMILTQTTQPSKVIRDNG